MRDLSQDSSLLSINSMTVKPWSLEQLVEGCARAGISAISPWRDIVQACGIERAAKLIGAHGMTVTGLCRGGMFPAADDAGRRAALDDNRRAVDEAAAIGAQCLILVVGGLPKGSRDIGDARRQVRDALAALLPHARQAQHAARDRAAASDVRRRPRLREHARARQRPLRRAGRRRRRRDRHLSCLVGPRPRAPGRARGREDSRPTTSTTGWCRPPISCSTAA